MLSSQLCLCISPCQIVVGSALGFCYDPRTNLIQSNIHRNIKAQMICMFYLSICEICDLWPHSQLLEFLKQTGKHPVFTKRTNPVKVVCSMGEKNIFSCR